LEKNRRYSRTLDADFFEPQPLKATTAADICKVTGVDLSDDQKASADLPGGEGAVSKTVGQQIKLGKELRNAAVMLKYEGRNADRSDEFSPFNQEITYTFLTEEQISNGLLQKLIKQPHLSRVEWINNPETFLAISHK